MSGDTPHNTCSLIPARVWAGVLCLCAVAWSFHTTSFMHAKELVLVGGMVLTAPLQWKYRILHAPTQRLLLPLMIGWLIWGLSGFFQAMVPAFLLEALLRWLIYLIALYLAAAAFSVKGGRLLLYRSLTASAVLVGLLALLQYAGVLFFLFPAFPGYTQPAYSVFGNQNLLGGYMALALVLLVVLQQQDPARDPGRLFLRCTAWLILFGALIVSGTRSAWLAAVIGLTATVFSILFKCFSKHEEKEEDRRSGRVLWMFRALTLLGTVLLVMWGATLFEERIKSTLTDKDVGGPARLWFWAGAGEMVKDHPWLGVGLGNFTYWSPLYQGRVLWQPGGERYFRNEIHTDQVHSELLQWLAETGVTGCLFWLIFIVLCLRRRRPAWPVLICGALFALFNNITHSPPHGLALLLLLLDPEEEEGEMQEKPRRPWIFAAVNMAVLCYGLMIAVPSFLQCAAEDNMDAGMAAEEACATAFSWPWYTPDLQESCAAALMSRGQYEEGEAFLLSALNSLDSHSLHRLLLYCAEERGDAGALYAAACNCVYRWPDDYHAWTVLLEHYPEEEHALWEKRRARFLPSLVEEGENK